MVAVKRPPALAGFLDDFDRLYGELLEHFEFAPLPGAGLLGRRSAPAVDVRENANGYTLSCELPGLSQKDIRVSVDGNMLRIRGGKKDEKLIREGGLSRLASWYNAFFRSLTLPPGVDVMRTWAELKNGVLIIMLPKKKDAKASHLSFFRI